MESKLRQRLKIFVVAALLGGCASNLAAPAVLPDVSAARLVPRLDQAFAATVTSRATGTILVGKGGRLLAVRSFTDPAQVFRPDLNTTYDLASIGKTFTAVLALKLAEKGKFDIDAPVRRYLPELPPEMSDITARNALAHDAGLPRYLEGDDLVPRTAAQALAEIAAIKRERKAGSGYYYSNVGPQLVALALERAGGDTYQNLVRRTVFRPLGMTSAYFHGDSRIAKANVAPAFSDGKRMGSPAEWPDTWTMLGAAGIAASVQDMWRFGRGVFAGSFLDSRSRQALLANGVSTKGRASFLTPDTLDIHYGAGLFHFRDRKGRTLHYHGGSSDFGTSTAMLWRKEDDVFLVAVFNSTSKNYDRGKFISAVLDAVES